MLQKDKYTLAASSILEVLLAMVILATSFGIALMVYLQVISSDRSEQKLIAHKAIERFYVQTKQTERYFDEENTFRYGMLYKTVEVKENNLIHFHFGAFNENNELLAEQDHYILSDE